VADDVGSPAATESWPAPGRQQEGYPEEWPLVALIVKAAACWRCEHCGDHLPPGGTGDEALTAHHLDGDRENLMSWNIVALCLRCHGLVERLVDLEVEQLVLDVGGVPFPWLETRRRDRVVYPYRPQPRPVANLVPAAVAVELTAPARTGRLCACGCGEPIPPDTRGMPRRYVDRAHQQRAYRERQADQRSLLTLLAVTDRGDS
jgi:hypothetical protein